MKNKIKEERVRIGLTQVQLAERVNVSRQSIIAIENGKYVPTTILALKLAHAFKKQVEDLFLLEKFD